MGYFPVSDWKMSSSAITKDFPIGNRKSQDGFGRRTRIVMYFEGEIIIFQSCPAIWHNLLVTLHRLNDYL